MKKLLNTLLRKTATLDWMEKILLFMKNRRSLEGCRCIIWRELFLLVTEGQAQRLWALVQTEIFPCVTLRRRENS